MNVNEIVLYSQTKSEIKRIKELRPIIYDASGSFIISTVKTFMTELMAKSLKEGDYDSSVFNYLKSSLLLLYNTKESIANVPLLFAIHLVGFLGFYPEIKDNSAESLYFNIKSGSFEPFMEENATNLDLTQSTLLRSIIDLPFEESLKVKILATDRQVLLDTWINYMEIHLLNMGEINSIKILRKVLN